MSTVMRDESLFFIQRGDGEASATTLFPPNDVLSFTSASGHDAYEEGRDYLIDKLSGQVTRLSGSRIPVTTAKELWRSVDPDGSGFMHCRDDPGTFLMCGEDDLFHRRQALITYTHQDGLWRGPVPVWSAAQMPHTWQQLVESKPLTIGLTGDSISEGYNASGFIGVPPYQPPYLPLVAAGLRETYGSPIALHNFAAAGWTADDGLADVARVADTNPDLVIVAYGMNDAGYAEAGDFSASIEGIMNQIRRTSPSAEYVLVSPMLPNPDWHYPVMARFKQYRSALTGLCRPGVVLADLTSLWTELMKRKSVYDLTGNGINHPNDFGHRLYAQVILGLFVDRD